VQWDEDGVAVFFFARNNIPSDISAGTPLPSKWGTPMAKWAAAGCDPFKFFYQQVAIFDTTLWSVHFLPSSQFFGLSF
jgi:hypothetical protein